MLFTVLKRGCVLALFALGIGACDASPTQANTPQVIQEPVFGISYAARGATFEAMPRALLALCTEYADTKTWTVDKMWIYASVQDGQRTYYVVGGTLKRLTPSASESRYELDSLGGVIAVEGKKCDGYGQAREVFDARYFEEVPQAVLRRLAVDLAKRLEHGLGGADRLRQSLRKQGVTEASLTPELASAFRNYISENAR